MQSSSPLARIHRAQHEKQSRKPPAGQERNPDRAETKPPQGVKETTAQQEKQHLQGRKETPAGQKRNHAVWDNKHHAMCNKNDHETLSRGGDRKSYVCCINSPEIPWSLTQICGCHLPSTSFNYTSLLSNASFGGLLDCWKAPYVKHTHWLNWIQSGLLRDA